MKINKQALKAAKITRADCLQASDIKDGAQLLKILKEEAENIKQGQQARLKRGESVTLAEEWGLNNILNLLTCLE